MKTPSRFRFSCFIPCFIPGFILLFTALLMVFSPAPVFANPVAVTLYPNDGKIIEQFTLPLQTDNGQHSVQFAIPIHAAKDTLAVNTLSDRGMRITSVTVEEQVMPPAPEADALKSQLKELKQKKSEQETRIKANSAFIDFWMTRAKTQPETAENAESAENLGNAVKKGITSAYDDIYIRNQTIEDLDKEIREIEKKLSALTGAAKNRWQVTVFLAGEPQPAIDLTASYHMANCGWRPTYTINARPAESALDLNWYAETFQNTGTDWSRVDITIATARPMVRPDPPALRDWIIQPVTHIARSQAKSARLMAEESMMAMAPKMGADAAGPPSEPAREAGFSFDTYALGSHSVKSGDTRRFTIREMNIKADFTYLIRPQAAPQAFLSARLNPEKDTFIPLPNGQAAFLLDSAFIANRYFSMHDPEENLFFGSDPQVAVTLTTLEKKSNETGLLFGKKRYDWGWKIVVDNFKTHNIDVRMEDAAPQIRDERIKLTESFDAIQPEKEDHLLKWKFSIAPGKKQALEYGFSVAYPDDMDVSFGGR